MTRIADTSGLATDEILLRVGTKLREWVD